MKLGHSSPFLLCPLVGLLTGCAGLSTAPATSTPSPALKVSGRVHGGQQPVSNATVQVYAVGTTGDGSAPTPLLTPALTSGSDGSFSLQGLVCPGGDPLIYITATGGNPGLASGTNNTQIALMTAIGHCSALGPGTFIQINEVTTVAAVAALAPFMSAPLNVGSSTSDASGLATAFNLASVLADPSSGGSPGPGHADSTTGYPATVPTSEIYSLADVLAACINSTGGVATDTSTSCGKLLSLTGGSTDTLSALIALEKSPSAFDTTSIFNLATADTVFQPTLTQPPDTFAIGVSYPPTSTLYAVVPQSFYPGETVVFYNTTSACPTADQQAWFGYPNTSFATESLVQSRYYGSANFIGEAGCGRLVGVTPSTGLPSGPIGVYTLTFNGSAYNYDHYLVMNVIPPPDLSLTFDATTLVSNGGITTAQFSRTTDLRNNTSSPVTLGQVKLT
ncbi:MAG: hypothetical protein V4555_02300, partial [Acidobacteriota bacterium]